MSLRSRFARLADDLSGSASTRQAVNRQLAGIGRMTELEVDRRARRIRATIELAGETEPLTIEIGRYELRERDAGLRLVCSGITTSRPWLTALAQNLLAGQELAVPERHADVVRALLA